MQSADAVFGFVFGLQILQFIDHEFAVVELLGGELRVIFLDRLHHGQTVEGFAQIQFLALIADQRGAQNLLRDFTDEPFAEVHQVTIIAIRLVEFQHREFWIVARGQTLVAEIPVDLEDLLEAAHHQTFQIQLRRDAQIHFHVQRVVMGLERLGRRASGDGVHHRCLDFHIVVADEKVAYRPNDLGAFLEHLARILICN